MSPSYVENDDFRVVQDRYIGAGGMRLRLRTYRLKDNPSSQCHDMSYSTLLQWARDGEPNDAVFHLGDFERVTA